MTWNNRWKLREIDVLAGAAIVGVAVLGVLVRRTLNPDGVSYLDLADALRRGDWQHFVQGYWSPLYPALLAGLGAITGKGTSDLVGYAHLVSVAAVIATIVVIWRWSRSMTTPWFGRAAIAALFVSSAEPPRVEALTPDLLLLCIAVCIAYELLVRGGRRWAWLGVLFGLAFLTKMSTWPWLMFALTARVVVAPGRAPRLLAARSALVSFAVALLWIVPMSVAARGITWGSTGRLNYHWYLEGSDARTPDTHRGEHAQYQDVPVTDSVHVSVASFDTTSRATYQPWSDPDGWSAGMRTHQARTPTFGRMSSAALDAIWQAVSLWLRVLLLAVLLPALWIGRRRSQWRDLVAQPRSALLVMLLGLAGTAQYLAVHAEPRLIAPFVVMFALGVLDWLVGDGAAATGIPATPDRMVVSWLGLVAAIYLTGRRIDHARDDNRRITAGVERLAAVNAAAFAPASDAGSGFAGALSTSVPAHPRVAVIGPVLPVLANIYWTGGRVVAQVLPASVSALRNLPVAQRSAVLHQMFHDRADIIWITAADGSYNIVRVP